MGSPSNEGPDGTLNIAIFLCLVIPAAVIYAFATSVPPVEPIDATWFEFEPLKIDDSRIKAERKKNLEGVNLDSGKAEIETLHAAIRKANLLQFAPIQREVTTRSNAEIEFAANEVITKLNGIESFVETSAPLMHACQTHVTTLLADVKAGKITLEQAQKPAPEQYGAYMEACGNAVKLLLDGKLIQENGEWSNPDTGPIILELLGRLRYAFILHLRKNAWEQITPYEREILWRWRIEDPQAYSYKERLDYLSRATEETLGYSPDIARGRLFFVNDFKRDARRTFEEQCKKHPQDRQLARACEWLKNNVAMKDPNPDGAPEDF